MAIELQGKLFILHGPPKGGKTQTIASFPKVQWIATEPGQSYVPEDQKKRLVRIPPGAKGWDKFISFCEGGHMAKRKPMTTAIDTVAPLYYSCLDNVCKKNGWTHPEDAPHGKGWWHVRVEFQRVLSKLVHQCIELESSLVFIDHSKIEEINTQTQVYNKISLAMPGQARSIVLPLADHIWYLGYDETEGADVMKHTSDNRCLWLQGTPVVEAGTQDPLITKSGIDVIEDLPMDGQFDFIYQRLNKEKKSGKKRRTRSPR